MQVVRVAADADRVRAGGARGEQAVRGASAAAFVMTVGAAGLAAAIGGGWVEQLVAGLLRSVAAAL